MAEEKENKGSEFRNDHLKKVANKIEELRAAKYAVVDHMVSILKEAGYTPIDTHIGLVPRETGNHIRITFYFSL